MVFKKIQIAIIYSMKKRTEKNTHTDVSTSCKLNIYIYFNKAYKRKRCMHKPGDSYFRVYFRYNVLDMNVTFSPDAYFVITFYG